MKTVPMSEDVNFKQLFFPEDGPKDGDRKSNCPYREFLGYLLYLILDTRPEIELDILELSPFVSIHYESHWNLLKRVVRYSKGTKELESFCSKGKKFSRFHVFVDASWAEDIKTNRWITGYWVISGCIS